MSGHTERGNVLFLILIAVALFAALSFAISFSMRQSGSAPTENARTYASTIVNHAVMIRNAIVRMRLSNGCSDTMLDFSNSIYKKIDGTAINLANGSAPADYRCHVFRPEGGNVVPAVPPAEALDIPSGTAPTGYGLPGHGGARVLQMTGLGTDGPAGTVSANDLEYGILFVKKDVCIEINKLADVTNPGGNPPADLVVGSVGTYSGGSYVTSAIVNSPYTNGKSFFCQYITADKIYQFFMAIVER